MRPFLRFWQRFIRRQPPSRGLLRDGAVLHADSLETHEKKAVLQHLLARLSAPERAALVLFEIEGYSSEEIATIQGIPLSQVSARIYRARTKLRTWLAGAEKQLRQSA